MTKWRFTLWIYNFIKKKWAKRKKEMTAFYGKKTEEKQNSADIMISVDGKKTVFPVKLKLQGESFE